MPVTQTVNSGDVLEYALLGGNEYTFTLCGSSTAVHNDSQLDLWDASFGTLIEGNDAGGCTVGSTFFDTIVYTPGADETVNLAIYRWFCNTIGGEGWTVTFSGCTKPADWTLTNSGPAGGSAPGACNGTAVFAFDCTSGFSGSSGGGPSAGFSDCQAVISGTNMLDNTITGEACMYSPVVDASAYTSLQLGFDWQLEDYAGNGQFTVEVYTGTAWQTVFTYSVDGNGVESIPVTSFINADFQVRYCFDTEMGTNPAEIWGMAIDNHLVCGNPPIIPTMSSWALICLLLTMLSTGLIAIQAGIPTRVIRS